MSACQIALLTFPNETASGNPESGFFLGLKIFRPLTLNAQGRLQAWRRFGRTYFQRRLSENVNKNP